jgi:hypothetical protein
MQFSSVLLASFILPWQSQLVNPRRCGYLILASPDLSAPVLPAQDLPRSVLP